MELLEFMRLCTYAQRPTSSSVRHPATEANRAAISSVQRFLDGKRDDLLDTLLPGWIKGYQDYLVSAYPDPKQESPVSATAQAHYATLRAMLRKALAEAFLPGIDAFAPWTEAKKAEWRPAQTFDYKNALNRLLLLVPQLPQESPRTRTAVYLYLLSMFCFGISIEEMLRLQYAEPWAKGAARPRVEVPSLGREIELTPVQCSLIDRINGGRHQQLRVLDIDLETFDIEAAKNSISRYLALNGIKLFRAHNLLSDWLGYVAASDPDLALKLLQAARKGDREAFASLALSGSKALPASDLGVVAKRWYAMVCYSTRLRVEKFREVFLKSKSSEATALTSKDFYIPSIVVSKKKQRRIVSKQRPAVGSLLFFRGLVTDARVLDTFRDTAWLLRDPEKRRAYAIIPDLQIDRMKALLKNYTDAELEEIDMAEESCYQRGDRVRLLNEEYEGLEGYIENIKETVVEAADGANYVQRRFCINIGDQFRYIISDLSRLDFEVI